GYLAPALVVGRPTGRMSDAERIAPRGRGQICHDGHKCAPWRCFARFYGEFRPSHARRWKEVSGREDIGSCDWHVENLRQQFRLGGARQFDPTMRKGGYWPGWPCSQDIAKRDS